MINIVLKADYTGALSLLLRYPSPQPHEPRGFIYDALYLEQNPTAERGSFIISKYSGKEPESAKRHSQSRLRPARRAYLWDDFTSSSGSNSPTQSLARNSPKSLETIFQDVSQGIQRRTESWGVAKAVRGAVTEARRNMQTMNYEPGLRTHNTGRRPSATLPPRIPKSPTATELGLKAQIDRLEERNQELATALGDALKELYSQLGTTKELNPNTNNVVKQTLERAESVQSCLQDASLPLPIPGPILPSTGEVDETEKAAQYIPPLPDPAIPEVSQPSAASDDQTNTEDYQKDDPQPRENGPKAPVSSAGPTKTDGSDEPKREAQRPNVRPSLSDAGFSWMLEGSRNLSSFVSSASVPPEETRHQESPRIKGSPLFGKNGEEKSGSDAEHDELAMSSLRDTRGPL